MCFAKKSPHRKDLSAKYDEEEGTVNEEISSTTESNPIPNELPEYTDNLLLNKEIDAHIFETKDQIITVWTSEETN